MALTEVSWRNTLSKPQTKDITPSLSVRRCLFGPVDHEIVRQDLQKEMKAMSESSAREWNFDFEKTCPLPGRYLWSRVETNPEKCNRRDTSVCRPQISSGNGLTKTTTKDFGCVNTSSKNASKLDRKTPQSHKITGKDINLCFTSSLSLK